jgi:hypothetical protein
MNKETEKYKCVHDCIKIRVILLVSASTRYDCGVGEYLECREGDLSAATVCHRVDFSLIRKHDPMTHSLARAQHAGYGTTNPSSNMKPRVWRHPDKLSKTRSRSQQVLERQQEKGRNVIPAAYALADHHCNVSAVCRTYVQDAYSWRARCGKEAIKVCFMALSTTQTEPSALSYERRGAPNVAA